MEEDLERKLLRIVYFLLFYFFLGLALVLTIIKLKNQREVEKIRNNEVSYYSIELV